MRRLIEGLGWLLCFRPRRTFDDVMRELLAGLEDGTIVIPGEGEQ